MFSRWIASLIASLFAVIHARLGMDALMPMKSVRIPGTNGGAPYWVTLFQVRRAMRDEELRALLPGTCLDLGLCDSIAQAERQIRPFVDAFVPDGTLHVIYARMRLHVEGKMVMMALNLCHYMEPGMFYGDVDMWATSIGECRRRRGDYVLCRTHNAE